MGDDLAPSRVMVASSARVLLFDLDGTLTDPRLGMVRSIRYALDGLERPCPPDDVLASFIGPPLRRTFATLLETDDRARVEEAMTLYRERYADVGLYENELYDGIHEMLRDVKRAAARAFVATGKPVVYAERVIAHFELGRHFAGVYGPELGGRFDDKAELLAHLLATEQIAAKSAVMIGDRAADIIAARANRVSSIGALWGYGSEEELRDAGADRLCAAPHELAECLMDLAH